MTLEDTIGTLELLKSEVERDTQVLAENRYHFDQNLKTRYQEDIRNIEPFIKLILEQAKDAEKLGYKYQSEIVFNAFLSDEKYRITVKMVASAELKQVSFRFSCEDIVTFAYQRHLLKKEQLVLSCGKVDCFKQELIRKTTISELADHIVKAQKYRCEMGKYNSYNYSNCLLLSDKGPIVMDGDHLASIPHLFTQLPDLIECATRAVYDQIR